MVALYFLLILLAMEVIGLYLLRSLEQYHRKSLMESLESQAKSIAFTLKDNLNGTSDIKALIDMYITPESNLKYIYILDNTGTILESSVSKSGKFLTLAISRALDGTQSEEVTVDIDNDRLENIAYPIKSSKGDVVGVVYLSASLKNIYNTLDNVKVILISATMLALAITGILGFVLAKTITDPIKELTFKVAEVARGDFEQRIVVKSRDEIGQLSEMFNILTRRLKETLYEIDSEKKKIEAILMYMSDGVLAINNQGEIIRENLAAREMILNGNPSSSLFEILKSKAGLDLDSGLLGDEYREFTVNIKERTLKLYFAPIKNDKDEREGYVVVLHDITEQHRLENMRKEFVANVSHELKTPLTTIKSYVETLLSELENDDRIIKQFLQIIDNEADRMARLVRDLLQLSKLDYQRKLDKVSEINLKKLLESVVTKLRMSVEEKNHSLVLDLKDVVIKGDEDKLEQVILNILSNSIKYTPKNGVISVSIVENDHSAEVRIKDNGIGIPKEDLPRIFERFYRVDKARSRELGGTGLGLSIAKEIVELHQGTIDVISEVGIGTEVIVRLPKNP